MAKFVMFLTELSLVDVNFASIFDSGVAVGRSEGLVWYPGSTYPQTIPRLERSWSSECCETAWPSAAAVTLFNPMYISACIKCIKQNKRP